MSEKEKKEVETTRIVEKLEDKHKGALENEEYKERIKSLIEQVEKNKNTPETYMEGYNLLEFIKLLKVLLKFYNGLQ